MRQESELYSVCRNHVNYEIFNTGAEMCFILVHTRSDLIEQSAQSHANWH